MKLVLEATSEEMASKALLAVEQLARRLAAYDTRLLPFVEQLEKALLAEQADLPLAQTFVVPSEALSKAYVPDLVSMGPYDRRSVFDGTGGLDIALQVPRTPVQDFAGVRETLDATQAQRGEDRKFAIRHDPAIYQMNEPTPVAPKPVPEWTDRSKVGEQARADGIGNLAWVQDNLDRRSWFLRQGTPDRLLPRDLRDHELYFIPNDPVEAARLDAHISPAGVVLPKEKDGAVIIPEDAASRRRAIDQVREGPPGMPGLLSRRTVHKSGLGDVALDVFDNGTFRVVAETWARKFSSLSAACDEVWAMQKGFASAADWRAKTGKRKLPSGAGWRFWGLKSAPDMTSPEAR